MPPMIPKLFLLLVLTFAAMTFPRQLIAQIPPHEPGTICFATTVWCWAQTPGLPGQACQCWNGNAWEYGTLG